MAKRSAARFSPSRLQVGEPFYSDADIDRILDVVGSLPKGPVEIHRPTADGLRLEPVKVDRRTALADHLESSAQFWDALRHYPTEPTDKEIAKRHLKIDHVLARLMEALGLPENGNLENMPVEVRFGPLYVEGGDELERVLREVQKLRRWSRIAAEEEAEPRPVPHQGNIALNALCRSLADTWVEIFEREPSTRESIRRNGTQLPAPMVRFIHAALKPLLGDATPSAKAVRARVQRIIGPHGPN